MSGTELRQRIADRTACVAVIGCGYVGLPLAVAYARGGFPVVALDLDEKRIAQLRKGSSYIRDVGDEELAPAVRDGRLKPTTDYNSLREADVIFVAVQTPFDRAKQPDLRYIVKAAEGISTRLRRGQLVILESTTYPGTTDEVMKPILERSGLQAGQGFFLAFSPERIDPGNKTYRINNTAKVVGGVDPESTELAVAILDQITEGHVHPVSSARVAELTKLLENTFRSVNIALVNELAMLCDRMQLDVWEVIDAAATKPYGFMPFYPGPGVGGHCIPVDPYYLAWKAREFDFHTRFIELAAETNLAMPFFTVERIRKLLDEGGKSLRGARVLALGAAFKRDIDDARQSPAVRVMEILSDQGADLQYHDPHIPFVQLEVPLFADGRGQVIQSVPLEDETLRRADCVVILVAHSGIDYARVVRFAPRVFDAVNATRGLPRNEHVERL
jgi:UDP-N-acetyl-D-glucosamine dehydrogenase